MSPSFENKTLSGIFWSSIEFFLQRSVGILMALVLAIFLSPHDYGLVAIMVVVIALASAVMDMGFQQALIRQNPILPAHFSTAFVSNLILSGVAYALLYASAPIFSRFYEEPELQPMVRLAGLVIIINAFQVVHSAILSRNMNFKSRLYVTLPAAVISSVLAVGLAWNGFGAWALIGQSLSAAMISMLLFWRLRIWHLSWTFERAIFFDMANFGYKLFLSNILDICFRSAYVLVIARIFGVGIAGLFFFSEKIKDIVVNQLVGSVQRATYPALSMIQSDDKRLKDAYRKVVAVSAFLFFPVLALLAALSESLFQLFLPDRWLPAVSYLQLMCVGALLSPIHAINLNILQVKGRSDLFLILEVFKKAMILPILLIGVGFGVEGILIGNIVASVLAYIPNAYFSVQLIDYSYREQLEDFVPPLFFACISSGLVFFVLQFMALTPLAALVLGVVLCGGIYVAVSWAAGVFGWRWVQSRCGVLIQNIKIKM